MHNSATQVQVPQMRILVLIFKKIITVGSSPTAFPFKKTINDKVQKQKKSTMGIKHASACAWNFFFLSFFSFLLF
jgi:hypothetical protein